MTKLLVGYSKTFCIDVFMCVWRISLHSLCLSPFSFALLSLLQKVSSVSLFYNHLLFYLFNCSNVSSHPLCLSSTCWNEAFPLCICSATSVWSRLNLPKAAPAKRTSCLDNTLPIFLCRLFQMKCFYILKGIWQWHYLYYYFMCMADRLIKIAIKIRGVNHHAALWKPNN